MATTNFVDSKIRCFPFVFMEAKTRSAVFVVIAVMPWVTRGFAMRATQAALWSMASMGHKVFFFAMASMGRVARLK